MAPQRVRFGLILLLCACRLSGIVRAQSPDAPLQEPPVRLGVFLDCPGVCDTEYLRQNIEFIDYVRDRVGSDVHVLVTTQGTGGGGLAWTVKFIGLSWFQGLDRTLTFTTPQTATNDDRRKEFARIFKIGLIGYAADTSVNPELDVTWTKSSAVAAVAAKRDPWNYWVFRIGTNGNLGGEQSSSNRSLRLNFSGSRTTENWKINISTNSNSNQSKFKLSDGTTVKSTSNGWNLSSLTVRTIGPKLSFGGRSNINHSSFSNLDRSITAAPAIEYDFFPYKESTQRSLTLQYSMGATVYNYREETIFDKLAETVPIHSINTSLGVRAPWGSVGATTNVIQHLNHMDRYRISFSGNTDVRLFKGFSFNVFGQYDRIRDQIGLRKGNVSEQDVLLRVQQLATGYTYFMNFGVNYSFGSIFNSTVNPRFNSGGF